MRAAAGARPRAEVAVAVVSYNTREVLRACLASVMADAPGEVLVVDNGSTDGSVEMVRTAFPTVRLIEDPSNPGYGAGANHAFAATRGPYVLLLNSDTVLPAGALAALHAYAEAHPRAGIVGPRLRNADGSLQRSCYAFPSAGFLLVEYSPLHALARRVPALRRRFLLDWAHDAPRAVPWVVGAALLFRRAALDAVGGFDPHYHMYAEEVDLAHRMAAAGWETHFAPVADVTHLGGASTEALRTEMRVRHFRSLIRFCARRGPRLAATRMALTLKALLLVVLAKETVQARLARDPVGRRTLAGRVEAWRRLLRLPLVREAWAGAGGRDG